MLIRTALRPPRALISKSGYIYTADLVILTALGPTGCKNDPLHSVPVLETQRPPTAAGSFRLEPRLGEAAPAAGVRFG